MMRRSIDHLDRVIRDLSTILETRSNRLHAKEIVTLRDMVKIIELTMEPEIIQNQVSITIDDSAIQTFHTIKSYFYSILYNLISNAIKYSERGKAPKIEITTFLNGTEQGFTVKDNGIGINLVQFRDRIFGLYQRFHLEADGKGMGICGARQRRPYLPLGE